jgi:hypothetical protein
VMTEVGNDDLDGAAVRAMAARTAAVCWAYLDTDLDKRKAAVEAWLESRRAYVEVVKAAYPDD